MIRCMLRCSVIFLSLLSFLSLSADLDTERTYKACGHPAYPPISWVSDHTVTGVGPYLIRRVFERFNVRVSFHQETNWKRCLRELEKGNIDVAVALYKTQYREQYYDYFLTPIVEEEIMLFYNTAYLKKPVSFSDVKNKTIGVLFGDSYGDQIDEWMSQNMRVETVSTDVQNFGKLIRGRIDYMPLGRYGGTLQVQKLGYSNIIKVFEKPLAKDYWYMAISKQSPLAAHLADFEQELVQVKSDIDIGELLASYSHRYISDPPKGAL